MTDVRVFLIYYLTEHNDWDFLAKDLDKLSAIKTARNFSKNHGISTKVRLVQGNHTKIVFKTMSPHIAVVVNPSSR